ncbi:unnamed protein product [Ambrosiozyma monospora]|uniref:Unnamed protein product n=1 Tax=Ambrosiozyma monospora TaxID=43982 RepID=A0ACB5SYB9_AMBMO|nr:unnamed protein product [Ambrosiozyma monospora]
MQPAINKLKTIIKSIKTTTNNQTMTKPVIAVFGTNGALGKPTLDALTSSTFSSKVSLPIRAITRDPSKYTSNDKIKYYKADTADIDSFKDALTGVNVLINLSGMADMQHYDAPLDALLKFAKSTVQLYIPSHFGTDLDVIDLPGFLGFKPAHFAKARAAGLKTVEVVTSAFFNPGSFLYEFIPGLDNAESTAVIRGDKNSKFDVSYVGDIGKAVAAIVTFGDLGALPEKVRISSDQVTLDQVLDNYEKNHPGVKVAREYTSKEATYKKAHELYDAGFQFQDFLFYFQYFVSEGYALSSKNEKELINPGESLFKWTKFGSI